MSKFNRAILIVDDNDCDRMLFEGAFRSVDTVGTIKFACDGNDAIAYLMGTGKYSDRLEYPYPTCILTDLKMPVADGYALLEHIKANPAWAVIPCIVFSDSIDPDDIRNAYVMGASSYHQKPQNIEDLRRQLQLLCQYWTTSHVPEVDDTGRQKRTESQGRIGNRFKQTLPEYQIRANP